MALWALSSGVKKGTSISTAALKAANVGFNAPVNPLIINDALTLGTANYGVACYEIRIDNNSGNNSYTNGVSGTEAGVIYDLLNRHYPNDNLAKWSGTATTSRDYGENLSNTTGNRIHCENINGKGQLIGLTTTNITDSDYFVVVYADNSKLHHIAKINEILTLDQAGDAFEFSPALVADIPEGTKFEIYKGPLATNTNVVAVAYGLRGSGIAADDRHLNYVRLSKPMTYFYNDRLERKDRLNHNTKYKIACSYKSSTSDVSVTGTASDATHVQTHFITEPNYNNRIVDYGPYNIPAKIIDNRRDTGSSNDTLTNSGSNLQVYIPVTKVATTVSDLSNWNTCFLHINRTSDNKNYHGSTAGYTGPTTYLHYDTSPDKTNNIPMVYDLEINQSIARVGSSARVNIIDSNKIWDKKIYNHDILKFKQKIDEGNISFSKDVALEGNVYSSTTFETKFDISASTWANNILIISDLPNNYDLRVLLQNTSGVFETIKVDDYHYTISSISQPNTLVVGTRQTIYQTITIDKERANASAVYGTADTDAKAFNNEVLYRRAWSTVTETLLVDFAIDTNVDYDGDNDDTFNEPADYPALDSRVRINYYGNVSEKGVFTTSRIYDLELELKGGDYNNKTLKVKFGDKLHKYIKLQTPRILMYQDEDAIANTPNYLDYFSGPFNVNRLVFKGTVETIKDKIEHGLMIYEIEGRDDISKLLGPILNKDYMYSEDMIYSTVGPILDIANTSAQVNNGSGEIAGDISITVDGTASNILQGDLLFTNTDHQDSGIGGDGSCHFIGRVVDDRSTATTVTFEEGILINLANNDDLYRATENTVSFKKAITSNPSITTTSSLFGTSGKGIIFNSGQSLVDTATGIPNTEGNTLIGTSSNSHPRSNGYNIYNPRGLNKDDKEWFCNLTDEISTITKKEVHTPSSLTAFSVINIDSSDKDTTIELAPNCPAFLARIDENPEDIRFANTTDSTLTDTNITIAAYTTNTITTTQNAFTQTGDDSSTTDLLDHIYDSTGSYIGQVLDKQRIAGSAWSITLDKLRVSPSTGTNIYRTSKAAGYKKDYHSIYFLNTQGLDVGGVIQLLNPVFSGAGKLIQFANTISDDSAGVTDSDFITRYGGFSWKYSDLQKSLPGSLSYNTIKLSDGENKTYYSEKSGQVSGYAIGYRFLPGIISSPVIPTYSNKYVDTNSNSKSSIENRGINPATGSKFPDDNYIDSSKWELMPKFKDDSAYGLDWNSSVDVSCVVPSSSATIAVASAGDTVKLALGQTVTGTGIPANSTVKLISDNTDFNIGNEFNQANQNATGGGATNTLTFYPIVKYWYTGRVFNPIQKAKDNWEQIDPKTMRYFIFGSADLYPDSKSRTNNLLNQTRKLTDYSIMLKNKSVKESSNINHTNYIGTSYRHKDSDNTYQTMDISESNVTSDEIKRFGLMRLIEMTFDWHYNSFDIENPPSKNKNMPLHTYTKWKDIVTTGELVGSIAGSTIVTTNANTGIAKYDRLYTSKGWYIGTVSSLATATYSNDTITLTEAARYDPNNNGAFYAAGSTIYKCDRDDNTGTSSTYLVNSNNFVNYRIQGTDHEDTFIDRTKDKKSNFNQGVIIGTANNTVNIGKGVRTGLTGAFTNYRCASTGAVATSTDTIPTSVSALAASLGTQMGRRFAVFQQASFLGWSNNFNVSGTNIELMSNLYATAVGGSATDAVNLLAMSKLDFHNVFNGLYGYEDWAATSYSQYATRGLITANEQIILPIWGRLSSAETANVSSIFDSNYYDRISASVRTDLSASSLILGAVASGDTTAANRYVYSNLRAIIYNNHSIENQFKFKTAIGMSTPPTNALYRRKDARSSTETAYYTDAPESSYIALKHPAPYFAEKHTDKEETNMEIGGSVEAGEAVCSVNGDGVYLGFKPVLDLTGSEVSTNTVLQAINTQISHQMLSIKILANDTTSTNQWLNYCQDLTGCYLVSIAGQICGTEDTNTDTINLSAAEVVPDRIHYIWSHVVTYSGANKYHHLTIDNTPAGAGDFNSYYKIMKPAEVCMWPKSPDQIRLYTMSSKYTKTPNTDEMYVDIPSYRYHNQDSSGTDAHTLKQRTASKTPDYNEAVLSMYVIVDPDAEGYDSTSTANKKASAFLVARKWDYLFGSGEPYNGNYRVALNDGNSIYACDLNTLLANTTTKECIISFSKNLTSLEKLTGSTKPQLNGIVSVGKTFAIKCNDTLLLNEPITAHIGSSVTICEEAEDIINSVLETHNITYTKSDVVYPYFTSVNFKGTDLYTATDYLAGIKQKRMLIKPTGIVLNKERDPYDYTNININHKNDNIAIISISKIEDSYSFFNDITVYGKNVRANKQDKVSINKIGFKSHEETNFRLKTKKEVVDRARDLMIVHNSKLRRFRIKLLASNLPLLNVGDIIHINLPAENIENDNYLIYESIKNIDGSITIEAGAYTLNMADRLGELIMAKKEIETEAQANQLITTGETIDHQENQSSRLIKIKIKRRASTAGSSSPAGTTSLGIVTDEVLYEEDYRT